MEKFDSNNSDSDTQSRTKDCENTDEKLLRKSDETSDILTKNKTNNIEFVFLFVTGLVFLISLLSIVWLYIYSNTTPHDSLSGEGFGLAAVLLFPIAAYTAVFAIWQFRLWNSYIKNLKHKYFQLILVFIFGVFPFINILLHLLLTIILEMKHPITEDIFDFYFRIMLFPITGGK